MQEIVEISKTTKTSQKINIQYFSFDDLYNFVKM
jgi:hypothetical protein